MAKVNVWTEYVWECSNCSTENCIVFNPDQGKRLPACVRCGQHDTCATITEMARPTGKLTGKLALVARLHGEV